MTYMEVKQWVFTLNGKLCIGHSGLLAYKAIRRYDQYAEEGFQDDLDIVQEDLLMPNKRGSKEKLKKK